MIILTTYNIRISTVIIIACNNLQLILMSLQYNNSCPLWSHERYLSVLVTSKVNCHVSVYVLSPTGPQQRALSLYITTGPHLTCILVITPSSSYIILCNLV